MACSNCFSISLPQCPNQIDINAGLLANTKYRWEIQNKFGQIFNGITMTDATGLLAIAVDTNPDIPKGVFMWFSGAVSLTIAKWLSTYVIDPVQFAIATVNYDCVEITFRDYRPSISYFDPDAAVYVSPAIVPIVVAFTNQTTVVVTHNLGFHPFITIEDTGHNVIGGNVHHDNNDQFTVSFNTPTSGTITYK